jgi:predicted nucleic acid-binding protein
VKGRLFDTNIVDDLLNASSRFHAMAAGRLAAIPADLAFLSAVTLGEIEYGILVAPAARKDDLAGFRRLVDEKFPIVLPVGRATTECYGELRRRLFERYSPKEARGSGRRIDQLREPASESALGVQENDLWLVAQAWEYNLVMVTRDKMRRLSAVASSDVEFEFW